MKPALRSDEIHLRDYLYILRKRRFTTILFAILVFAAGVTFTFHEKILYLASSTILIEKDNPNIVDFQEVMSFDASSSDYYQTQYQMLKSHFAIGILKLKQWLVAWGCYLSVLSYLRYCF